MLCWGDGAFDAPARGASARLQRTSASRHIRLRSTKLRWASCGVLSGYCSKDSGESAFRSACHSCVFWCLPAADGHSPCSNVASFPTPAVYSLPKPTDRGARGGSRVHRAMIQAFFARAMATSVRAIIFHRQLGKGKCRTATASTTTQNAALREISLNAPSNPVRFGDNAGTRKR